MRWRGLVIVAALALAPAAHAATLQVSPSLFSPERATLRVQVHLTVPRQVGREPRHPRGQARGLDHAARTAKHPRTPAGTVASAGTASPTGDYIVRLVYRSAVLATSPLRIDSQPPRLRYLHGDNGSSRFAGDGPLLTTISPNGDKFRDNANVRFSLGETATVTMEVTRTVKAPHPRLHADGDLQARHAHDDVVAAVHAQPAHLS